MGKEEAKTLDRAGLERCYLRLEKPMYNVAYRWVWNPEEAQELVQDTFLKLWRVRERIRTETLDAYAYRVLVNLASKRRRRRRLLAWLPIVDGDAGLVDRSAGPESNVDSYAVRRAVEELSEAQRQVLLLSEFSGMSYRAIAESLAIPEGTVASRRNKAVARLKTWLGEG